MSLRERLQTLIAQAGPLSVAQYMTACLYDPDYGYYATRPALGPAGDFITAPLVSQMFGELIGVWAAAAWEMMGRPAPFRLVEMGPGDGTLMSDVLRAVRLAPGFLNAAEVWLVEVSEPLKAVQRRRLGDALPNAGPNAVQWAKSLDEVPGGAPLLLSSSSRPPRRRWARRWAAGSRPTAARPC
jgi:SAM-dependent MidA family methyltransferase